MKTTDPHHNMTAIFCNCVKKLFGGGGGGGGGRGNSASISNIEI